jgi:hypothetical protein
MDDRIGNLNHVLWWGGWKPLYTLVIGLLTGAVLGFLLDAVGVLVPLGIVGGLVWWITGTRYINAHAGEVMREYGRYTERMAQKLTGESNAESYTLTYSSDGSILVDPAEDYFSTTLLVSDNSAAIHEGVGLDMVSREPYLNDDTREVYYDQITSVRYKRPTLEIGTSDGGTLSYRSSREPDDALNDLQARVRSYKAA